MRAAVLAVFKDRVPPDSHRGVVDAFEGDVVIDVGEDVTDDAYAAMLESIPALQVPVKALLSEEDPGDAESPAMIASAIELVLEGLHLSKRLNKDGAGSKSQFRSRS